MATIYIDNTPYTFEAGDKNLLEVCLSLGFNVPYFCWHPALHSVGACRQCAVKLFKDENDTRGKMVMSCMTPATDGARISINDPDVVAFRAGVIEWLMVNHPHDCPVCDEGGECHLQDMTVMTGHVSRKYRFKKRTYRNQNLGPFVNHEMNRCIQCYRCVRFYKNYAGGRDLDVFAIHDHVYFGRHTDGVLENEFSGNLVEVCPTGVFTDKTLKKHYTRKWDLQTAPSLCTLCGAGCNTIPGERYGTIRRIRNRFNGDVNGYFLCDRGRYGYEFINSAQRLRHPLLRVQDGTQAQTTTKEALRHLTGLLKHGAAIGIGSPGTSLEANFALRTLVGEEHFYHGLPARDFALLKTMRDILQKGPAQIPSLQEIANCDAVLVLGEDVTNTMPRVALALRQAVKQQPMEFARKLKIHRFEDTAVREVMDDHRGPLFIATPDATRLDEIATTYRAAPEDIACLGFAVAHALNPTVPSPALPDDVTALARQIADALHGAARPLVLAGPTLGDEDIIQAAANVAWALQQGGKPASLSFVMPECNSLGTALLGGHDLEEAVQAARDGKVDTVILMENDLYRRVEKTTADALLAGAKHVVVLDTLASDTSAQAEVVLPAATYAEADGTLVNFAGRAQRFYQVFVPKGEIRQSWRWLGDLRAISERSAASPWPSWDDLMADMAKALPVFSPIVDIAPPAGFRIVGEKIAREPHRYSGRTAITANVTVHEPKPPDDPNTPLSFSMEGYAGLPPAPLIPRFWAPGWNSVQAVNKFQQEVGGALIGGNPGKRLLEPPNDAKVAFYTKPPAPFAPQRDRWQVVPAYHIFGSEPLSMYTPGIAELAPEPYVAFNATDAAWLNLLEGERTTVTIGSTQLTLPVHIKPSLPLGVAAIPSGLPGIPVIELPAWGQVMKKEERT